ncbi:MAG: hypothetical protein PHE58_07980, partial [Candidatus Omnitrophica bacterium]|nr:hypothetical protein [Candidatus Omnitrophota bacterium]
AEKKVAEILAKNSGSVTPEDGLLFGQITTADNTWVTSLEADPVYADGKTKEQLLQENPGKEPQPVDYTYAYTTLSGTFSNGVLISGNTFKGFVNPNDAQLQEDIAPDNQPKTLEQIQQEAPQFSDGFKRYSVPVTVDGQVKQVLDNSNYAEYSVMVGKNEETKTDVLRPFVSYMKEGMPTAVTRELNTVPADLEMQLFNVRQSPTTQDGETQLHQLTSGDDKLLPSSHQKFESISAQERDAYVAEYNTEHNTALTGEEFASKWNAAVDNIAIDQFPAVLEKGYDPKTDTDAALAWYDVTFNNGTKTATLTYRVNGKAEGLGSETYSVKDMPLDSITLNSLRQTSGEAAAADRHVSGDSLNDVFENGAIKHSDITNDSGRTAVDYTSTVDAATTIKDITVNHYAKLDTGAQEFNDYRFTASRTYEDGKLTSASEKTYTPQTNLKVDAEVVTTQYGDSGKKFSLVITDENNKVIEVGLKNGMNDVVIPANSKVSLKFFEPADNEDGGKAKVAVKSINGQPVNVEITDPGYSRNNAQIKTEDITGSVWAAQTKDLQLSEKTERAYEYAQFDGQTKLTKGTADYFRYTDGVETHYASDTIVRDYTAEAQLKFQRQESWANEGNAFVKVNVAATSEQLQSDAMSLVVIDDKGNKVSSQALSAGSNEFYLNVPSNSQIVVTNNGTKLPSSAKVIGSMEVDGVAVQFVDDGKELSYPIYHSAQDKNFDISKEFNAAFSQKLHLQEYSEQRYSYEGDKVSEKIDVNAGALDAKKQDNSVKTRVLIQSGLTTETPLTLSGEFKGMQIADKAIAVTRESITGPFDASLSDVRASLIDKGISTDPNRMLHYEFKDDQYSYYRLEETIPMTFSEWPFAGLTGSIHKDTNFRDKTLTLDYNVN